MKEKTKEMVEEESGLRVEGQCEIGYPGTTLLRKGPVSRHKVSEEASHEDI